jgi:hypothetical protein
MEAGSHPVKNSVISRQLRGFGVPDPAPHVSLRATVGPNVARFLVKPGGQDHGQDHGLESIVAWNLGSDHNGPGLQLDNKEPTSWR